jgi:molecular chaperone GrpE (heat shock protein)
LAAVQVQVEHALRELENAKMRVERDARAVEDDMRRKLVAQLLPVLDNLDRAVKASRHEGVRLVREQLEGVLRGYGVERVSALAQRFDPKWMDAIGLAPIDDPDLDGIVVEQMQPCYRFEDMLLRPAQVVVGRLARG